MLSGLLALQIGLGSSVRYTGTRGVFPRIGLDAVRMSVEGTANVVMSNQRGRKLPYLFGTRVGTEDPNAGAAVLVRLDSFNPFETQVADVEGFK